MTDAPEQKVYNHKSSKTDAKRIVILKRNAEIIALRNAGLTTQQISDRVHIHRSEVCRTIKAYLAEIRAEGWHEAEMLRSRDNDTLDQLQAKYYPLAMQGDRKAGELVLKILTRRAMLNGLDASQKLEIELPPDYDLVKKKYQDLIERKARALMTVETTASEIDRDLLSYGT